jgi:hypothetical protein
MLVLEQNRTFHAVVGPEKIQLAAPAHRWRWAGFGSLNSVR